MPNILENIDGDMYVLLLENIQKSLKYNTHGNVWLNDYKNFFIKYITFRGDNSDYIVDIDIEISINIYYSTYIILSELEISRFLRKSKLKKLNYV